MDGQLFLLKQLLVLKQQIVAFDIEFVTPEVNVDFSNLTTTFWELRARGGLFNPSNLVRLVGSGLMPRVVENMLDAKSELDGRLRKVINDFTNTYAARMTSTIDEQSTSKSGFNAAKATQIVRSAVEKELPLLRSNLNEYLEDVRTKETLVAAVQDQTLANYEDFFDRHLVGTGKSGGSVSKKGKGRQQDVWDPDTFADWAAMVFDVQQLKADDGGDGRSPSPTISLSGSV